MLSPLRMPFRHARVADHLQPRIIEQVRGICMSVCAPDLEKCALRKKKAEAFGLRHAAFGGLRACRFTAMGNLLRPLLESR